MTDVKREEEGVSARVDGNVEGPNVLIIPLPRYKPKVNTVSPEVDRPKGKNYGGFLIGAIAAVFIFALAWTGASKEWWPMSFFVVMVGVFILSLDHSES